MQNKATLSYLSFVSIRDGKSYLDAQIGSNVECLLRKYGLKKKPFAISIGIDEAQFRRLIRGKDRWNTSHIDAVASALRISPADLIEPRPEKPIHPPSLHVQTVDHFSTFDGTFAQEQYIPIRLLGGRAAAGPPSEVRESDIEGWVLIYASREWMPHDPENYTCVRVAGQSMYPILYDGDIVAIDHMERDPAKLDKKMVVFRIDGGITIKWLRYFAGKNIVVGVPENKDDFDNVVTLKEEEINDWIVGKVAWWWAKR